MTGMLMCHQVCRVEISRICIGGRESRRSSQKDATFVRPDRDVVDAITVPPSDSKNRRDGFAAMTQVTMASRLADARDAIAR
jgi:hypothetical protein